MEVWLCFLPVKDLSTCWSTLYCLSVSEWDVEGEVGDLRNKFNFWFVHAIMNTSDPEVIKLF